MHSCKMFCILLHAYFNKIFAYFYCLVAIYHQLIKIIEKCNYYNLLENGEIYFNLISISHLMLKFLNYCLKLMF